MIRVFENTDISTRNSFHVHQRAAKIVEFDYNEELPEVFATHVGEKWMALGGGNNILFTKDIDSTLVVPCNKDIEIVFFNIFNSFLKSLVACYDIVNTLFALNCNAESFLL